MNVVGTELRACSARDMPVTGFSRDRTCSSHRSDAGSHHVCLKDVGRRDTRGRNFCDATGQDDWCSGQKSWCVCEWAFDAAVVREGCDAFEIDCDATNAVALQHYRDADRHRAAECLRQQCPPHPEN